MEESDAKYHLKRCVDSGLWVPDAAKADTEAAEGKSDEAAGTSSSDTVLETEVPKPNISTEDVD